MAAYRLSTVTTTKSDSVSHTIQTSASDSSLEPEASISLKVQEGSQDTSSSHDGPPAYTPVASTRSASVSITRQQTSSTSTARHRRTRSQTTEERTWRFEFAFEGGPSDSGHVIIRTIVGFILGFAGMCVSIWAVILARILPSFRAKPHPSTISHHIVPRSSEHPQSRNSPVNKADRPRTPVPSIASGHTSDASRKVTFQLDQTMGDPSSSGAAVASIDSPVTARFSAQRARPPAMPPRSESIDSHASSGQASCSSSVDYQTSPSSGLGAWYKRKGSRTRNGKEKAAGAGDDDSSISKITRSFTSSDVTGKPRSGEPPHLSVVPGMELITPLSPPDTKHRMQISKMLPLPKRNNSSSKRRSLPPDAFSNSPLRISELLASPESYESSEIHSLIFSPTATVSTTSSMDGDSEKGFERALDTVRESPSKESTSSRIDQSIEHQSPCEPPSSTSSPAISSAHEKEKRARRKTFSFSPFTSKSSSSPPVRLRTNPYAAPFNAPLPVARERHRSTDKRPQELQLLPSGADAKSSPSVSPTTPVHVVSPLPASSLQLDLGSPVAAAPKSPNGIGLGKPSTMAAGRRISLVGGQSPDERRVISESSTTRLNARSSTKPPAAEIMLPSKSYSDTESASPLASKGTGFGTRRWPGIKSLSSKKAVVTASHN